MSTEDHWADSQIQLAKLISAEVTGPKGFNSRRLANDYIRRLFIQYNEILKKLDDFYEICLHPQKRTILRLLLNGLVGRLIELKSELIKFDACELTYFEDLALDEKKTLDDFSLRIPRFFAADRSKNIAERNETIESIVNRLSNASDSFAVPLTSSSDDENFLLTAAVRILQAHERARQGRLHAFRMYRMKHESNKIEVKNRDENVLIIQTVWRQKNAEKFFEEKKFEEKFLLGMILPPKKIREKNENSKKNFLQNEFQREFERSTNFVKNQIRLTEGFEIRSRLENVLEQWLLESRQLYGQFPIYPSEDLRGSAVLFKQMTIDDVQQFVDERAEALKNKKTKRKVEKKLAKTTKNVSSSKFSINRKQKIVPNELAVSKFLPMINDQLTIYKDLFYERDESFNKAQRFDFFLAKENFRDDIENELRDDVDRIIRNELIYLKFSIDKSEDPSTKKKSKKKKQKRQKKPKDFVANRTNESIFEELVETGIIRPTKNFRHDDFIGDFQFLAETIRFNGHEPMPSLLDCLQLIILHIIYPLSSNEIHSNLPAQKAVLLVGPSGSGKEMLVHIACNELGGLLVDLTPSNLINSFNSAEGLKILLAMLKRLISFASPIICLIRDTEILFAKKLTNEEKLAEPRRFQRSIRKFMKKLQPGERILFVGLSTQPYRARIKILFQLFHHVVLFPRPNYGSRRKIFFHILIEKFQMKISEVELSLLASISNGFTGGKIVETIESVVSAKQKQNSNKNFCSAADFVAFLGVKTPVFIDEENQIKNWYNKTPTGVRRLTENQKLSSNSKKKRRS